MLSGGGDQQGGGGGGGGGQWTKVKGHQKGEGHSNQPDILHFSMIMKNYIVWNKSFEVKKIMIELEWSELVKLICNVTACCKMYVLSCNCYKKGTKMFCMFKSTLYLLERQKKVLLSCCVQMDGI